MSASNRPLRLLLVIVGKNSMPLFLVFHGYKSVAMEKKIPKIRNKTFLLICMQVYLFLGNIFRLTKSFSIHIKIFKNK